MIYQMGSNHFSTFPSCSPSLIYSLISSPSEREICPIPSLQIIMTLNSSRQIIDLKRNCQKNPTKLVIKLSLAQFSLAVETSKGLFGPLMETRMKEMGPFNSLVSSYQSCNQTSVAWAQPHCHIACSSSVSP